ncbi:MAG: DUF4198 domain-containing protein [Gammaproteobacteria bacterium]
MKLKHIVAAVGIAALGVSLNASAHRPWLYPHGSLVEGKEPSVTIDGAISEGLFDVDHMPLKLDTATVTEPDGTVTPVAGAYTGRQRSTFDLKMAKNGTYKISIVNKNVFASWKDASGETKRFRGTEQAFAKEVPANAPELRSTVMQQRIETFVSANKPSDAALKPSGSGLELVPVTNPTDLRSGESATFRFQLDGKALPNFPFSLIPGGVRYRGVLGEIRLATNAQGEAVIKLPAPGMYYLNASFPVAQPQPGGEQPPRRYSYAATLEVLPE